MSISLAGGRAVARSVPARVLAVVAAATLLCAFLTVVLAGPAVAATSFTSVSFVDAQNGWFTGVSPVPAHGPAYCRIWRTTDGGKTVKQLPQRQAAGGPSWPLLCFIDRAVGIWSEGGFENLLQRTADNGTRWTPVFWPSAGPAGIPNDLGFADASNGWVTTRYGSAGDSGGEIARTTDGGATWNTVRSTDDVFGFYDGLSSPSAQRCYVLGCGELGGLWVTTDGGGSWKRRAVPGGDPGWGGRIAFPAVGTGWLIGSNGIARTTNGGQGWTKQPSGTQQGLVALDFVDTLNGWAVGQKGAIVATRDGGAHWRPQSSGTTASLSDVDFVDRLRGWAVGMGVRLRTTDGGKTWKKL